MSPSLQGQNFHTNQKIFKKTNKNGNKIKNFAPEFSFKFQHTLYLKCEYYMNQKT